MTIARLYEFDYGVFDRRLDSQMKNSCWNFFFKTFFKLMRFAKRLKKMFNFGRIDHKWFLKSWVFLHIVKLGVSINVCY